MLAVEKIVDVIAVVPLNRNQPAEIANSLYPILTSSITAPEVVDLFIDPEIFTVCRTHLTCAPAVVAAKVQVSSQFIYFCVGLTAV